MNIMSKRDIDSKIPIQREHEFDKAAHLKELKYIFNKLEIPYYLAYGMVLSAVRNRRFIFNDGDIDFIVRAEDIEGKKDKLIEKLKETGHDGFREPDENRTWCTKNINGYISEFDLYIYPKKYVWRYEKYKGEYWLFPEELFGIPTPIHFYGEVFPIPTFPEEYLRICYGNSWRIQYTQPGGTRPHCLKLKEIPTVEEYIKMEESKED